MPDAEPAEEDGPHVAAILIQNGAADGAADHHDDDHGGGAGEQNGMPHEGNGIVEATAKKQKSMSFLDHDVRSGARVSCTLGMAPARPAELAVWCIRRRFSLTTHLAQVSQRLYPEPLLI